MSGERNKDPERVRLGRLGALRVHSRGRTNTVPARAAFLRRFEIEVDPDSLLPPAERERRAGYAMRAHMIELRRRRSALDRQTRKGAGSFVTAPAPETEGTHDAIRQG